MIARKNDSYLTKTRRRIMQRKNRWFIGVILIISLLTILFLQYQSKIRRKGIHTTTDKFVIPKGTQLEQLQKVHLSLTIPLLA